MSKQRLILRALAGASAIAFAVVAHASTLVRTSAFTYDGATGLLLTETVEPDTAQQCVITTYTNDAYGNRLTSSTANCAGATGSALFAARAKSAAYAAQTVTVQGVAVAIPAGAFATSSSIDPAGVNVTESRTIDPRNGQPLSVTDANGLVGQVQYDDFQRKVLEIAPDGNRVRTSYCLVAGAVSDTSSNSAECPTLGTAGLPSGAVSYVQSVPQNSSGTQNGAYSRTYYDRLGRPMRSETQGFDATGQSSRLIVADITYNINGVEEFKSQPYFLDTGASVASGATTHGGTLTQYDVLGRSTVSYVADETGNQASVWFPTLGTRRAAMGTQAYSGLQLTVTNDKGQATITTKDALGRRLKVLDAQDAQLAYLHDPFDNLIRTRDALGNITQAVFDVRGRRTSLIDPDAGTLGYDYNALGELVWQQNPTQRAAGTATQFTYDALGRMTQRSLPEYATNYSYDKYADASACAMGKGKLCEVATTHGVDRKVTYDSLGRPSSTVQAVSGGPSFTASVTYDGNGRVATRTWPTGVKAGYAYTTLGYLEKVTNAANNALIWQALKINAWGKVEQETAGNGVSTTRAFDATSGQAATIQAGASNSVLNLQYVWDNLGNLYSRVDNNGAGTGAAVSEYFYYDGLNRLSSYQVQSPAIADTFARTVYLQYNALGSLLYKSDVGVYTYPTAGSARPHAVSNVAGTVYSYDANGNMTAASAGKYRSVTYTSFNLPDSNSTSGGLLGADGTRYAWKYGVDMERVQEVHISSGQTRTTWTLHPDKQGGLGFEQEITGSAISNRHYISATSGVIAVLTTQGDHTSAQAQTITASVYWHRDHLGSLAATTDASGTATRYAYDPFGKRRYVNGNYDAAGSLVVDYPSGTDRGYTGHEHLDDVGIIHMNGRLYDPLIGRFMQADPSINDIDDLQTFNLYSYVRNNPLNAIDPTGYWSLRKALRTGWKSIWHSTVGRIAISVAVAYFTGQYIGDLVNASVSQTVAINNASAFVATTTEGSIAGGAAGGFAGGLVGSGGNVKEALKGAIAGGAFGYVGSLPDTTSALTGHAVVGCASAMMQGGNCAQGAASQAFSKYVSMNTRGLGSGAGFIVATVSGGTATAIGGGKFANGALTAAYGYLFNECAHTRACGLGSRNGDSYSASVPWQDDSGKLISGADGKPLLLPPGFDVQAVLSTGRGTSPYDVVSTYENLSKFAQGGPWDLQRLSGTFNPNLIDSATVLIGAYGASSGIARDSILAIESSYAIFKSNWKAETQMSAEYPSLPNRNVVNTDIGYGLISSGRVK